MEVCTIWPVIFCVISTLKIAKASVNTSREPNIKSTSQSSDYNAVYTSDKVVDGCTNQRLSGGCCTHTGAVATEAWWQIDLSDKVVIEYINIFYRNEGTKSQEQEGRFGGYKIYQSNETEWRNSDNCYTDTTSTASLMNLAPLIESCTGNTRYLTIYVDRRTETTPKWYSKQAILELCEVEVYGCPVGKYGGNTCDSDCDTTCVNSLCHPDSGQCTFCAVGFYKSGVVCTECHHNCLNDICDVETGVCEACDNGYHGNQCDQPCPDNCKDKICDQGSGVCEGCRNSYHGLQCNQTCSVNCLNNTCNQHDGQCLGCRNSYHGLQCNQTCSVNCLNNTCNQHDGQCLACRNGYHGAQCIQTCSVNCLNSTCKQNDGQCLNCEDRFFGLFCTACSMNCADPVCDKTSGNCSLCRNGYHGLQCNQTCSVNCLNNTCTQNDGQCLDCVPGLHGSNCGLNCSTNCRDNMCIRNSGMCTGCDSGYHGSMCLEKCPINCKDNTCIQNTSNCEACKPGNHGDKCEGNCTANCLDNVCNQTSGQCTECVAGYYTTECNQPCPINCKESHCDRDSGECPDCIAGLYGRNCSDVCPAHCTSAGCQQNSGQCIVCARGYYGLECEGKCGQCSGVSCNMTNGACECSDGWEGDTCLTRKAEVSAVEDQTGVQAGAGVGAVVAIALVVIVTVIILRRRRLASYKESPRDDSGKKDGKVGSAPKISKRQNTYDQQPMESTSSANANENGLVYVNLHDIDLTTDDEVVYNNVDVTSVPVHELRCIIDRKMPNKAVAFQEEFKTFPWGAVHPCEAGKKVSNKARNRFKTTFPYDHSRIILETIGNDIDTTYTNANYIDSVETTKRYIASQGPKPNTLDDFWRMVWQVSSGKIIMLTNIMEGGIVKCHKYWPDEGEPLSTQTFHLKLDREMTYAFYVIRDISIVQKKTKQERQVQQFHFTTWPDHGTPDTLELVLFHRRVTSYATQLTGQMVVHCSAGIGRTGTFIGLDALFTHGKKTGQVDIPRYIRTMRKDRMNMIQTYEQYIALHELLVEGFNLQDSHISRTNFPAVLTIMCPTNKPANQTKTHQEFKALQNFTPSYTPSCFKAAMLQVNKDKNRNMDILAADKFRAFLQSQPADRTDYINAVMIQSHTSKSGYLMTQFPLEDTVDDFWTMVSDYSCENIVVLGQPTEECWFQEDVYSTSSGAFVFKKLNERSMITDVTIADYQVIGERNSSETSVRIFTMTQWSSDSLLPPSDSSLLLLLEQVDSRRRSDNTKPVVVMCRDGCTQSGLLCCISNIRDQMKMDEEVDIFQTARQLRKRRPEAIGNVKQYQCCYNILGQYLDSTEVYMN